MKLWIDDLGTNDLVPEVYGVNQQTVYTAAGQWQSGVDAVAWSMGSVSPAKDCGNARRTNKVLTLSFTDPSSRAIAANGGYVATDGQNSFVTWRRNNWTTLDSSQNYSKATDGGSGSGGRVNSAFVTLYLDNQLVGEWTSVSQSDSNTGIEPCPAGGGAGAASLRQGPKSVNEVPKEASVLVAPNPVHAIASVHVGLPVAGRAVLEVRDLTGALVYAKDLGILGAGWHARALPTAQWASGIYFVGLSTDQGDGLRARRLFKMAVARK